MSDRQRRTSPTPPDRRSRPSGLQSHYSAPKNLLDVDALPGSGAGSNDDDDDALRQRVTSRAIAERESAYHQQRRYRQVADGRPNDDGEDEERDDDVSATYRGRMAQRQQQSVTDGPRATNRSPVVDGGTTATTVRDDDRTPPREELQRRRGGKRQASTSPKRISEFEDGDRHKRPAGENRARRRWDETPAVDAVTTAPIAATAAEKPTSTRRRRWDETPVVAAAKSLEDEQQPSVAKKSRASRWDETPAVAMGDASAPAPAKRSSRWDETPAVASGGATAVTTTPAPSSTTDMATSILQLRADREMAMRNRPWTAEMLDKLLPREGFTIVEPPADYQPLLPAGGLAKDIDPSMAMDGVSVERTEAEKALLAAVDANDETLPLFKPEDVQHFGKLLTRVNEEEITLEEAKERKVMRLLLRIKNGSPQMRGKALKQISERARDLGAGLLFDQILPLFMSPTLEDQERHMLVKVIDRVLFKLGDLVRPHVHKILVVMEPLLIDEDYYARMEGREIISNLAKAAGLPTMITTMRPDIDHVDEYVRNTTARAFAVVASALGIPALLPFFTAVCRSQKSWQARHTGAKIIQQIAILMGCAVLPHLKQLVSIIAGGLNDDQHKVRTMTALALAALGDAAAPYGIESFDQVLRPLWEGIRRHRGKGLAAFLKAIGCIIPLMDPEYANKYTKGIMPTLIREFETPDEEMKKIVLKVVRQCAATDGVDGKYLRDDVLPQFFKFFWIRRMSMDRRNYRALVETTVELAIKVGAGEVVGRLVPLMRDEQESFRKMATETIDRVVAILGVKDIDDRQEKLLVDGLLFVFQEHKSPDFSMLDAFGRISHRLGMRLKPHVPQICSTILWRLNNKSGPVRQHAAELVARVAPVMSACEEEALLLHMGQVLFEQLGEEFPEVLSSVLAGLAGVLSVVGMTKIVPPVAELLPRLTPILKNRHERVSENVIVLVGKIAERAADQVSPREWMRICFDLLELLKAQRKTIRRAAIRSFGYIAKAIGPADVLATLLNNLKVQERQYRVCTTIAIAIVAENCMPFTILPAMMNEYRVPDLNVQNGVLKSLAFMFEYIGEMCKDYVYAVTPLLEDALIDRDVVHRQIACNAIKHLAVTCAGTDREDALTHLLNLVWPNVFETVPHMVNAFLEAVEGLRVGLGSGTLLQYLLTGLFHPARKVRESYWRVYNMIYMAGQSEMVPFHPRVPNDGPRKYSKHELDYIF